LNKKRWRVNGGRSADAGRRAHIGDPMMAHIGASPALMSEK
jgi:hypothetical protein